MIDKMHSIDNVEEECIEWEGPRYRMYGVDKIPFGSVNDAGDRYFESMMSRKGMGFWNKSDSWNRKYGGDGDDTSIQGGGKKGEGNRMKIHAGKFYSTTGDRTLRDCKMKFKDMFWTRRQRKAVKVFLHNCYLIGKAYGIPEDEISYLKVTNKVVFLTTIYNGVGIKGHKDSNFKGAVFCYVSYVRNKRKGSNTNSKESWDGKYFSFGIRGFNVLIPKSTIKNLENQLYFFWGAFTDWAIHGVPRMKGWIAIIHIFRQARE